MHKSHKITFIIIFLMLGLSLFGQQTKEIVPFFSSKIRQYDSIINKYIYTNPQKALESTYSILEKQNSHLDNLEKAHIYSYLRRMYHLYDDPFSALYYGYKAMLIYKLYNRPLEYSDELNKVACIYRDKNLFDNYIIKFLEKNINSSYNKNIADRLLNEMNLILLYKISGQKIPYNLNNIILNINKIKNPKKQSKIYKTLSFYYSLNGQYDKAIAAIKKAIFLSKNPHYLLRLYLDLTEIYLEQKNIPSADKILDNILPKIYKHKDIISLTQWYLLKAKVKLFENDFKKAIEYAQKGLRLSIDNNLLGYQGDFYKILSELYMQSGKSDLAFVSFSNYIQIKDSMHSLSNYYRLNNIIVKLNSIDIKRENILLKQQAQYEELRSRQQKLISLIFGLSAIALSLLLAFVYYLFRMSAKSEQRLKKFAEISLEAILILDYDKILEFNDKFIQLTGYIPEEVKNLKLTDLLDPILVKQILETNNILNFETYLKRKNGTTFKAEILSRPFSYSSRKKVKIISIRDVSDFYNAQKELIESQIKFRALIDTSPDGVIITDPSGKINFASQSACQILEIENKSQILGQYINQIILGRDLFSILMTSEDKPVEFIFEMEKPNVHKYIETKLSTVKAHNNETIALFVIIRDVTNRISTEEALRQSERKFRELYTKASDGLLIADQNWKIQDANPASEKIFGIPNSKIKGHTIYELIPNLDPKNINLIHGSGKFESTIRKPNGVLVYTQISISKLNDQPANYLLIIRDITEILKNQEELKQYAEKLEISNQAKAKLFSIISHDLRGPIGNLKAMIELILENPSSFDTNEIREILTELKNTSVSTFELLENLLYWAKSQLNQIEYSPSDFNISEPVNQILNLLRQTAKRKEIQIIDKISPNSYFVKADVEMVKIILRNLISNAIKFTPRGGTITLLNYEDENSVIIGVKDTGIGIPYEKLIQIFETDTFFTTYGTEKEKGTGLGLQIVKEFVAKNKGKLWVESKPGKGTTFYFSLPKTNK